MYAINQIMTFFFLTRPVESIGDKAGCFSKDNKLGMCANPTGNSMARYQVHIKADQI